MTDTQAQQIDGTSNFAYGVFTGTGRYKVRDRTLYVVRVPLFFDGSRLFGTVCPWLEVAHVDGSSRHFFDATFF